MPTIDYIPLIYIGIGVLITILVQSIGLFLFLIHDKFSH